MRAVWAPAPCMATTVENYLQFVNVNNNNNNNKTRAGKHFHKGRPEELRGNLYVIFSFLYPHPDFNLHGQITLNEDDHMTPYNSLGLVSNQLKVQKLF